HALHSTLHYSFLFLFTPPRPPTSPLFPYTTLFRSPAHTNRPASGRPIADDPKQVVTGLRDESRLRSIRAASTITATQAIVQAARSEEHTSELQSPYDLVCRLLLEKKKKKKKKRKQD